MIAAQLKSNYSKLELFDYFVPLEKKHLHQQRLILLQALQKKYDESFAKNTFCIHPTIIQFLTAMELSVKKTDRYKWDEMFISDLLLCP
jgi:hypothetical protein